jgi:hypothetical protein
MRIGKLEWIVTLREVEKIRRSLTTFISALEILTGSRTISSVNVTSEGTIDHLCDYS